MTMLFQLLLLLQLLSGGDLACVRRLFSKHDQDQEGEVFSNEEFHIQSTFLASIPVQKTSSVGTCPCSVYS